MLNFAINNEMEQGLAPIPFLTNQPPFMEVGIMANQYISDPPRFCQVEGCENIHKANGYCEKHYMQIRRHGEVSERTRFDANEIVIDGDVAFIHICNVKLEEIAIATIDASDVETVKKHKWHLSDYGYVVTNYKRKPYFLSRLIMAPVPKGMVVDHKDRIRLNNRRSNLRYATRSQNSANSAFHRGASGSRGISWDKARSKWIAKMHHQSKHVYIGRYDSKEVAIAAYNKKVSELRGEFAVLNDIWR